MVCSLHVGAARLVRRMSLRIVSGFVGRAEEVEVRRQIAMALVMLDECIVVM